MSLGENAWVRSLDTDDLQEFAAELGEALAAATADRSDDLVNSVVRDWRVTARQLEDPLRRRILRDTQFDQNDYEDAGRPSSDTETAPTEV